MTWTDFCCPIESQNSGRIERIGALGSNGALHIDAPAVSCSFRHNRYLVWLGNTGEFDDSVGGARGVRAVRGQQTGSADRARCVREEPRVDAVRMEGVAALGQPAELLVACEFTETDRALARNFFCPRLEILDEIVIEHREAFNGGSVETTGALSIAGSPRPSSRISVAFLAADAKTNEENHAQHHDDDRHGCVEMRVEIFFVSGWGAAAVTVQFHSRRGTQIPRASCDE